MSGWAPGGRWGSQDAQGCPAALQGLREAHFTLAFRAGWYPVSQETTFANKRIGALFVNAGVKFYGTILDSSLDEWQTNINSASRHPTAVL